MVHKFVKRGDIIHVFGNRGSEVIGIVKDIERPAKGKKHSVIVKIDE